MPKCQKVKHPKPVGFEGFISTSLLSPFGGCYVCQGCFRDVALIACKQRFNLILDDMRYILIDIRQFHFCFEPKHDVLNFYYVSNERRFSLLKRAAGRCCIW